MNRKIKYILIAIIGTVAFSTLILYSLGVIRFDFGIDDNNDDDNDTKPKQEDLTGIDLIVDFKNGTIKKRLNFTLSENKTSAFHALDKWCEVEYTDYGTMGILITSIDSVSGNWLYSVNGTQPGASAIYIYLKDYAVVKWWKIS